MDSWNTLAEYMFTLRNLRPVLSDKWLCMKNK